MELRIIASLSIKSEEFREEILKALHTVVDGTRTEEGNISYDLHQDINDPAIYTIVEVWKSQEAIDLHNQTAHFQDFVKAVDGKVDLAINIIKKIY